MAENEPKAPGEAADCIADPSRPAACGQGLALKIDDRADVARGRVHLAHAPGSANDLTCSSATLRERCPACADEWLNTTYALKQTSQLSLPQHPLAGH